MAFLSVITAINYGLVLIYGLFLSVDISGGCETQSQKRLIFACCPIFLFIQGLCSIVWDVSTVEQLYPLITHLPLVLILVFALKKPVGTSIIGVSIGYLCCHLPRWVNLVVTALSGSAPAGELCYTLSIIPIFLLLRRWFVRPVHEAMTGSTRLMVLFGSLPVTYYFYDYATTVYSGILHTSGQVLLEFLPTVLLLFYVSFLTVYHMQSQEKHQSDLQRSLLEAQLKQTQNEMENLRHKEMQIAIYQHDMRHHLTMLSELLAANTPQQAEEYIKKVRSDVEAISPKRFCENELINLLCSSFSGKAERMGIRLSIDVKLPNHLSIPDPEFCSILSNALENALRAASSLAKPDMWVEFYCGIKSNKLLIEVKNPYVGEVFMRDGLPVSEQEGHGYGCRSIRSIVSQNRGVCTFEAENSLFTLRIVLPAATK